MTERQLFKQAQREADLALLARHDIRIIGPKGGIFYLWDDAAEVCLNGYGLYGNAVTAGVRIVHKRYEPKPSELSEADLAESKWEINPIESGYRIETRSKVPGRFRTGKTYDTEAKALRRLKVLTCRDIARRRVRQA